jgi:hypothetical protein
VQTFATPLPGENKLAKLVFDAKPAAAEGTSGVTPASAPRPSSARTHVRAPRTSNGKSATPLSNLNFAALPTQHELQFQTPATNGRPWDVSPLAPSPLALPVPLPVGEEDEEDFSEIEYMPPKLQVEETWVPPFDFDLPHYGDVGKRLRERACAFPYDDEVPAGEPEWEGECGWDVPALPLPVLGKQASCHFTSLTIPSVILYSR